MPSDEYISAPWYVNASCTNGRGDFNCECNAGFIGDDFKCENINECDSVNSCNSDAICSDNNSSYSCQCKNGFDDSGVSCDDINECDQHPCDQNANCTNTVVFLPVLADRAFMPMVTTVLISTSAL